MPGVGTTIFSLVTAKAAEYGALNIGQGFPDYPIDEELSRLLANAVASGSNQYAPMAGDLHLREQICAQIERSLSLRIDPEEEVTITCGATEALFDAILTIVGAGDEVIFFDPAYDSYAPAVALAGGRAVRMRLSPPDFAYDWDAVRASVTPRTRLIIVNSPNNPSCRILGSADLDALAEIVRGHRLWILSDEVYERIVYDGRGHCSVLLHPELRARAFAVYSFGKVLHATGWRTGYCIAPSAMTRELRKVHQFNTFSIGAPFQRAIAEFLSVRPAETANLAGFFQRKRDWFVDRLRGTHWQCPTSQGTYFQLLDYSALDSCNDVDFAERLIREAKVAVIPLSPFYADPPAMHLVRVCLAKRDETLALAAERLIEFARKSVAAQGAA